MTCPVCGKEAIKDSDFCTFCGADLHQTPVDTAEVNVTPPQITPDNSVTTDRKPLKCPVCGKDIIEGSDFCTFCGVDVRLSPATTVREIPVPQVLPEELKKTNGVALAALICGAIPFTALIGFFLALIAIFLVDANRARQKGMNLAVIGGMLSVLWFFVGMFALLYLANNHTGGSFGREVLQGMKYGAGLETKRETIYTLIPAASTGGHNHNMENLKVEMPQSADIIKSRLVAARVADTVDTTNNSSISITVTLSGLKNREQAINIMKSTEGMPVSFVISSERQMPPGVSPIIPPGYNRSNGQPYYRQ